MTLLTASQVATELAISRNMVYSLAASGRLPVIRIGGAVRFDPSDVQAFVEACKVPASVKPATRGDTKAPTVRLESRPPDLLAIFRRAGVTPRLDRNAPARRGRKPKQRADGN